MRLPSLVIRLNEKVPGLRQALPGPGSLRTLHQDRAQVSQGLSLPPGLPAFCLEMLGLSERQVIDITNNLLENTIDLEDFARRLAA